MTNKLIKEIREYDRQDIACWWLGQIGFVFKLGDKTLYVDAFLTDLNGRNIKPLIRPEEVEADYILGTHDHIDHIDRPAWREIVKYNHRVQFIVPGLFKESIVEDLGIDPKRVIAANEGKRIELGHIWVSSVASAHEFLDQDQKTKQYPYLGYIIEYNNFRIYHSGDTCLYPGLIEKLKKFGKLDLAILPINGRDGVRYRANWIGNLTFQEAVDLSGYIKPEYVIPAHYEMFDFNSEDVNKFSDYIEAKYPSQKHVICEHGKLITF
ncbi:MAG: MBL fold metallo-hydrolase [Clostridiales bacterium]|nr:MBL fold metallo-hydrolase [Clostridiales bacterium]